MAEPQAQTDGPTASEFELKPLDPLTLLLDPHNPRLTPEEDGSSQEDLLRIMIQRFKIEELAESIISSGFHSFDPIVAYADNGAITVLEGNRRVAAIKLLLDPCRAPPQYQERWRVLNEKLPLVVQQQITQLSARIHKDRRAADVTAYIGFRHVTGVLKWLALEKAKFIAHLIEDQNWDYQQVAERLGSYPRHVERHYVAYRIAMQAEEEGIPGAENIHNAFGVLLRALQAGGISQFLAVTYPGDPARSRCPISQDHVDKLRDFVKWTFGTKETNRILPDSRRLTDWGRILQSAKALSYLRRTTKPNFDRAFFRSGAQADSLADSLFTAADRLEEGVPLVSEHNENEDVVAAVEQCTSFLKQILRYFPKVCETYGIHIDND